MSGDAVVARTMETQRGTVGARMRPCEEGRVMAGAALGGCCRAAAWQVPTRPRPVEGGELGREWGDDECAICAGCLATRGRVVVKKKLKMEAGSSEKRQEHRYYSSR